MTHTVIYNPVLGVIETVGQGKLTLSEAKEIITEITKIAVEKDCYLCLSDYRQATVEMSITEIFDLPRILADIVISFGLYAGKFRRALVIEQGLTDFRFFETVTINFGQHIRLFHDIDEAKKWLFEK
jgi:hypothetical protein